MKVGKSFLFTISLAVLLTNVLAVKYVTQSIVGGSPAEGFRPYGISYDSSSNFLTLFGNLEDNLLPTFVLSTWSPEKGLGQINAYEITPPGYEQCSNISVGFLGNPEYTYYNFIVLECLEGRSKRVAYFVLKIDNGGAMTNSLVFIQERPYETTNTPVAFLNDSIVIAVNFNGAKSQIISLSADLNPNFQVTIEKFTTVSITGYYNTNEFVVGGSNGDNNPSVVSFSSEGYFQNELILDNKTILANLEAGLDHVYVCLDGESNYQTLLLSREALHVITANVIPLGGGGVSTCLANGTTGIFLQGPTDQGTYPGWILNNDGNQTSSFESKNPDKSSNFQPTGNVLVNSGRYLLSVGYSQGKGAFAALDLQESGSEFRSASRSFQPLVDLRFKKDNLEITRSSTLTDDLKVAQALFDTIFPIGLGTGEEEQATAQFLPNLGNVA
mmetsp:Transcript_61266/g.70218  ORF Transcript_61266/g.70218 Transcript_61266/m.70218 type:complete len:442 (+) Transcript_61266:621-1946(+)|eukprot:CAMPEP_0114996858 /NCGR_PEP_ID=MMETSP0216-20121206/14566_1 /TAXON_ID=223996 /ORGANISM="Protocruzia adherens, Strain Boccale" /LENGTH=441 /DNA_ID=CAMNT_0002361153 /DNA_START=409 /DNA_END=1734 /DNA_ORIENTATION=-